MSDALSDDGSDFNQDDTQEDVMTPAELIAKLEEVGQIIPLTCRLFTSIRYSAPSSLLCPCVSPTGLAK